MALSQRGTASAKPSASGLRLFEILQDRWDADENQAGWINLGLAENALMHDALNKHVHDNMNLPQRAYTYGDGGRDIRDAVAHVMNRKFRPFTPISPRHVVYVNGCNSAIEHLSWALADPGDMFLLGQPYYKTFIPDISARFGTGIIEASFNDIDPLSLDAVSVYEKKILAAKSDGKRISALLISHPHNPLGRCYPREVLIELMRLCDKHSIHFISDEIYALSTFPNRADDGPEPVAYESVLSIDTNGIIDPKLVHVLWGMSKDFGASGFRLGFIISQANIALQAAILPVSIYSSTSSLSEHVTANALRDDAWVDWYIEENQSRLADNYEYVTKWAKTHGIEYAPGVNSAFFLWVNLGEGYTKSRGSAITNGTNGDAITNGDSGSVNHSIDEVIMKALLHQKVFLGAGDGFGSERPGWFRIVFTQKRDFLDEGLRRTLAAIGWYQPARPKA